jgi:hypothetical protein
VFTVTHPNAPMEAVDPDIFLIAFDLSDKARAGSPYHTGNLADGYHYVRLGTAHYAVRNGVPYWRFVEFGFRRPDGTPEAARPAFGRALHEARVRWGALR